MLTVVILDNLSHVELSINCVIIEKKYGWGIELGVKRVIIIIRS